MSTAVRPSGTSESSTPPCDRRDRSRCTGQASQECLQPCTCLPRGLLIPRREVAILPRTGPQGQEGLQGHAAVPVQTFAQPGIGLDGEPGDRGNAVGCFPGASQGTGAQGMHSQAAQPPASPRGLLSAHRHQPRITRQALFLAVLYEVGQGHATILPGQKTLCHPTRARSQPMHAHQRPKPRCRRSTGGRLSRIYRRRTSAPRPVTDPVFRYWDRYSGCPGAR
jgi:hypothetical protein